MMEVEGLPFYSLYLPPHSAKPSPEEIRLWSQSFDKLMRNPAGRNVFREFLRTEYSEENMLFWLACEDLKQEANGSAVQEKAYSIYENYISIFSPKERAMFKAATSKKFEICTSV
ncbi:unnamed protein product [Menidia menidia]|uniref:(Atlantic silverside) hypothetical protein n=1 Tax=Menidia menidia TaxID=238744 RepID=A0A8S4BFP1_9TELE|nr:unnamed protein product [Menidia menidia]